MLEGGKILVLQRVVHGAVPVGKQHIDVDHDQNQRQNNAKQAPRLAAFFRDPVRFNEMPDGVTIDAFLLVSGHGVPGKTGNRREIVGNI